MDVEAEQTLRRHGRAYQRMAQLLLDLRPAQAAQERERMLAVDRALARKHPQRLTELEALALRLEVQRRRDADEAMVDIADDLGVSRRTLYRRLDETASS